MTTPQPPGPPSDDNRRFSPWDRRVAAYSRAVVRWRWIVLLLAVAVAGVAAAGAQHLRFRADYRYNFGAENPQLAAFEAIQNTYTKSDNVLFVLAPRSGDVFSADVLEAVVWLTEASWQLPYSIRVDSISNFQHTWAEEDDLIVEDLVLDGAVTDEARARVREVSLTEPLLAGKLVARDAGATAVNVTIQGPDEGGFEPEVTAAARALVAEVEARHPQIDVALTGITVLSASFDETAKRDLATLVPLMYLALVLTMLLFLRSLWGMLATLFVTALAAATAMGLGGWIGIPLTPPSATAPTIILTIAIADGVHILVTFTQQQRQGLDKIEALVESMRLNWQPVFLTSLTTVIGFLSLNFSDAPPFRDMGNLTAMGVAAAWFYSITFLPAFVALVPYKVRPRAAVGGFSMESYAEWLIAHKKGVLAGMIALVVTAAAFVPRIELNDMFVTYFGKSIEFRRDTDFATENLAGIYMFHYSVASGEEEGINDPAYLAHIDAFSEWLRAQPEVSHVSTLTDTMKRLNKNMHGDDDSYYRLPEERELAAQYLLLYEMSLPYGLDLNNQINVQKSSTRVTATIENVSTRELRAIDQRAQDWLGANTPPVMHTAGAGTSLMFANISHRNIESMVTGTILAFLSISLILAFALRSARLGALSLVPNLVPTIIAFGVWGILIREVGMAVATVTTCSLGIIVDATVHFFSKYLRARREQGVSSEDAVRYALSMVGSALWITFLILVVGFSVLALSPFKINAHFGLLVAITIAAALLADFLLLPTLLMRIDRRRVHA